MNEPEESPRIWKIRISERAARDIDEAFVRFGELEGEPLANEWLVGLQNMIAGLATLPLRAVAPEANRFPLRMPEVREIIYRRRVGAVAYRVLFQVFDSTEDGPIVFILHIRHGAKPLLTRKEAYDISKQLPS